MRNMATPAPGKRKRNKPDRLLLRWHRWCGLAALLFLLIASISGTLLVYKQALIKVFIAPDAHLPLVYSVEQLAPQLELIATRIQADSSGYLIKAPNADEPYWTLTRDADKQVQLLALSSLEPYTRNLWLLDCLSVVRELHTELFTGLIGETVLLISGLLALVLTISGVILWWPSKRSFRWRWVFPNKPKLAYLMHYHRHAGTLVAPMLLIILLTGSIMLWQKLRGPLLPPPANTQTTQLGQLTTTAKGAELFLMAQQQLPDAWPTYIRLATKANPVVNFRYRLPDEWHPNGRTAVKIDLSSGLMTLSARADQVNWQQRLINQNYPLHSGYGMNSIYRLFIFIGGIALLWLSITGGLSYLRKHC
jgi:uncharacterized iron-regulated membrane protein